MGQTIGALAVLASWLLLAVVVMALFGCSSPSGPTADHRLHFVTTPRGPVAE